VVDVDIDLRIAFILLWIVPEIGEWGLEDSCADGVGVGYVVPFILAFGEDFGEGWPESYVGLDEEDAVFVGGKRVVVWGCSEIGDEDSSANGMSLFGQAETNTWGCELVEVGDVLVVYQMRLR
jgi:hypothetical protein